VNVPEEVGRGFYFAKRFGGAVEVTKAQKCCTEGKLGP
jgi:hypothetical protein